MPRQWLAVYLMMIVAMAERGGMVAPIDEWEVKKVGEAGMSLVFNTIAI